MKPVSEYYSDDGQRRSSVLTRGSGYRVATFDSYFEKLNEAYFDNLEDAENYAEDYVMGVTK